jgi:hypothetical protein
MTRKGLLELVSAGALLAGGLVAYGRFSDRLDQQDRRIEALERSAQPGTKLADICLELVTQQTSATNPKDFQDQMNRFHCYDRVAASTSTAANAGEAATMNVGDAVNATDTVQNNK